MKSKMWSLILAATGVVMLVGSATPAHATFPGKNGRIAFVLGPDIYTMNPDGTDVYQLTNLGPDSSAFWESWSPDGKQIVFSKFTPPDIYLNGQLWIMNADGSNQHLLLAEPGFTEMRPSFSPDGKTIIFSRGYDINPDSGRPFIVQLYRINVDGTRLIQLTTHTERGVHDYGPKYSPDGASILFQGDDREGIMSAAWLSDTDGSDIRQVTPSEISGRRPDWSPDGKQVAFQTHCCNPQNPGIAIVNIDGNALREITDNGTDLEAGPQDFDPSWSPEGNAIVFERQTPNFAGIVLVTLNNGNVSPERVLLSVPNHRAYQLSHNKSSATQNQKNYRRIHEIEDSGALPRWGPAPN